MLMVLVWVIVALSTLLVGMVSVRLLVLMLMLMLVTVTAVDYHRDPPI